MKPITDDDMIVASQSQPDKFAGLFERHWPSISRYLIRRLGKSAGEDIAAEVFLQAFRSRARYEPTSGDARPWLFGIASNLVFKQRRKEARHAKAMARAVADEKSSEDPPEIDDSGPVLKTLANLDRELRDVVALRAWAELSYAEIAVALDIPEGTVKSRLNRARKALSPSLDKNRTSNPLVAVSQQRVIVRNPKAMCGRTDQ